jgi:uncharacterized protein DUF4177
MYEYKFVRIGEGVLWAKREADEKYKETIVEHARQGWRLVQIFAPGMGAAGRATFFEIIFERPVRSA